MTLGHSDDFVKVGSPEENISFETDVMTNLVNFTNAQVEIRLNMGEDIDQLEPPKFWRSLYTITIFLHKLSTLPSLVNFDLFHFEK